MAERPRFVPSTGEISLLRGAQRVALGGGDQIDARRWWRLRFRLWRLALAEKLSLFNAKTRRRRRVVDDRQRRICRRLRRRENFTQGRLTDQVKCRILRGVVTKEKKKRENKENKAGYTAIQSRTVGQEQ